MRTFTPPEHPVWSDDLLEEVDRVFEETGADTPGWPDPHPDRHPAEEEYSRCLDPGVRTNLFWLHSSNFSWYQQDRR